MSSIFPAKDEKGNSKEDWEIFDILCQDEHSSACGDHHLSSAHHPGFSLDLVTALRSELAALSYKRDRLMSEITDTKTALYAKETECENLRAQTARQSALIASVQSRLQAAEVRERNLQAKCDSVTQTIKREKKCQEEENKELLARIRRLEVDLNNEESHKDQTRAQLHELIRKLCICLNIEGCEDAHLSPDCVIGKAGEVVSELQRLRTKLVATCDTLRSCENELMALKSSSNVEKQRLENQIESLESHNREVEGLCRQMERDLKTSRDRLTEHEITNEKLREELRGFESRCHRLQDTIDRFQNDRMLFLGTVATLINAAEPCETLIKDKIREILNENQALNAQLHNVREQLATEIAKHKEDIEEFNMKIRSEESQRCGLEERLEKASAEIYDLRNEHMTLSEFLLRLSKVMHWSECTSPPAHGPDTTILAETLLERAERLTVHYEHHAHPCEKHCWEQHGHHHNHHPGPKIRREKSCHDIPSKESTAMYTLQRRVRVLREQVQRRDLHLELLRRKIALLEDNARGKSVLQAERDEAMNRSRRTAKQAEKLSQQLVEAKAQIAEIKAQLAEAAEIKITALERARKIDELTSRICELEGDKQRFLSQISSLKERVRSASDTAHDRRCKDESFINSLKDDVARLKTQLVDTNHRLSHLQAFRTAVARTLHSRDIPEADLLRRLQALCEARSEFVLPPRRYESTSPAEDHGCSRYTDLFQPSLNIYRPLSSSSPSHHHRHHHLPATTTGTLDNTKNETATRKYDDAGGYHHDDHHHHHSDDEFNFHRKY